MTRIATTDLELKKLEYQEFKRECTNQLHLKELELNERELALWLKIKELELPGATASSATKIEKFDMSKHIKFVPLFQDTEVDNIFYTLRRWRLAWSGPKECGHCFYKVH